MKARINLMNVNPGIIQAILGLEKQVSKAGLDHKLLDRAHTELWFNRFAADAQGWGPVGIAGGAPGVNAELEMNPITRDVIVVMSNRSPPSAARVAQQLEREVRSWSDGS